MTPWKWWAGEIDCETYDLACECSTRDEAVQEAARSVPPGTQFKIVEARSSEAKEHIDFVPFLRTRNAEVLVAGLHLIRVDA